MPDPVAWTFGPGGDYTEELGWLTDVLQAPTGGTQHRRLREVPRTVVGFAALAEGDDRRLLDWLLRTNGAGRWQVPVAIDARTLTAAVSAGATVLPANIAGARFVAGGQVLVMRADPRAYEVRTIASMGASSITVTAGLTSGWAAGTQIIPLRLGRLAEAPQVARFTADASGLVDLRFRLEAPLTTAPAMPGATYRSYPVFDTFRPVWRSDPVWTPERRLQVDDNQVATPLVADIAGVALGRTAMQYAADTAADVAAFRAALFAMAGRWAPVWVPSWAQDLRLVAGTGAGQGYIDVAGPLLSGQPLADNHRDIRIELVGGTTYYRRITAATAQSATVDRLDLDATLPAIALGNIKIVSFLALSTQDADTNTLAYWDANTLLCELVWRELDHAL